ncbi:asparagine synthase (glutamine-hydrolyzing) [Candidatus Paracaedibacter symbiosus]|uniref:asparagine synthase (glutamine-hydrolyzing) n=1 Tax=Candidatus Paracaedibacter symbiosus TaxID=244582 RepID=UPI0005096030|nr:asparagine synthase (glutamine-hydrolyzing) [Candidatus Paracaedibacter symbiosus]
MCGIVGIYSPNSEISLTDDQFHKMRDEMFHRGPDGGGSWRSPCARVLLGHRRLSIIDLNTTADQPMCNEDGMIWVTFNGEIYNHLSLREELKSKGHTFRTDHSDTEVLVHGFEEWGIEGLAHRIEGDYAFAIWCGRTQKLYALRDRMGVKPLYFSFVGPGLVFASEIKALLKHPQMPRDVNPVAMYHYLSFLTTPAPMTMFEGIYKLPAGHYIEMDNHGNFNTHRYWNVTSTTSVDMSEFQSRLETEGESYLINEIRSRLIKSVEDRMMADVPMGVFLSGGIDSSVNAALMSRYSSAPVRTFTVGFKDYKHLNELDYAKQIAKEFKTDHHEILIDRKDMESYLQNLVHSQDEPLADWVCIPLYFVSKLAKDSGMTVIQVGEGSDEQFSGYASYMGYLDLYKKYWTSFRRLPKFVQGALSKTAIAASGIHPKLEVYADIISRAYNDREHFWSGATVFWDTLKKQLVNKDAFQPFIEAGHNTKLDSLGLGKISQLDTFSVIKSFKDALQQKRPNHDILSRMIYNEFQLRLPELLLMRVDKITMSQSLEARVPFLDHKLVEFSYNIPMEYKVKNNVPKYILKKAVEGIIPDNIIYRKKMGFGAPMSQWLNESFGKTVEDAIMQSPLLQRGFFNKDYIKNLFAHHRSQRRDNSLYIWTIFNLTSWYDYWIEGKNS